MTERSTGACLSVWTDAVYVITKIQTPNYLRAIQISKVQWHTLPVEAYGMTHTTLHGRLPRMLRSSGNIQLYTRIKLRAYGATPTTLQHSTDTVRSHGAETLRAASSARSGRRVWTIASL